MSKNNSGNTTSNKEVGINGWQPLERECDNASSNFQKIRDKGLWRKHDNKQSGIPDIKMEDYKIT